MVCWTSSRHMMMCCLLVILSPKTSLNMCKAHSQLVFFPFWLLIGQLNDQSTLCCATRSAHWELLVTVDTEEFKSAHKVTASYFFKKACKGLLKVVTSSQKIIKLAVLIPLVQLGLSERLRGTWWHCRATLKEQKALHIHFPTHIFLLWWSKWSKVCFANL